MNVVTFPTVTRVDFPDGITCTVPNCGQRIMPGQPYKEKSPRHEGEFLVVDMTCVYH